MSQWKSTVLQHRSEPIKVARRLRVSYRKKIIAELTLQYAVRKNVMEITLISLLKIGSWSSSANLIEQDLEHVLHASSGWLWLAIQALQCGL